VQTAIIIASVAGAASAAKGDVPLRNPMKGSTETATDMTKAMISAKWPSSVITGRSLWVCSALVQTNITGACIHKPPVTFR
jgi:hypothetical protein